MKKTKHTPTPWNIHQMKNWPFKFSVDTEDKIICDVLSGLISSSHNSQEDFIKDNQEQMANAERIVKCVNAHDDLMQYVKQIADIGWDYSKGAKELLEKYGDEG